MNERQSDSGLSIAQGLGQTGRVAVYECPDTELAVGSTLGGSKAMAIIKASGAIEKFYSVDMGHTLLDTIILRHYEVRTGMYLAQARPGTFYFHPEHQVHTYELPLSVKVMETVFVLSGQPGKDGSVDPPGLYQSIELSNEGDEPVELVTYAYAVLRGTTGHDVVARYDRRLGALVVWNTATPDLVRVFGCSVKPETWETTLDMHKAVSDSCPGPLSCTTDAPTDPLGVLQHTHHIAPGKHVHFTYLASCGKGQREALKNYRACPPAQEALDRTKAYYHDVLCRSVVLTPDPDVNRGVLWAKANMLRVQNKAATGWCFTNDPTRSNNSVGRDTAWYGFGADYLTPEFARESLKTYVRLQEESGLIVEYYDIRTGKTETYGLNINDNTPLIVLALWHHYNATGDRDFLREVYPSAAKAMRYVLSQRNDQGLVWCTADGVSDWGVVGWRNVIPNYRLSGATTEVNSECYAAFKTVSHMARVLDHHADSEEFDSAGDSLKEAINRRLFNRDTDLYYLHIDLDGNPRSDVTSDLVFPIMFGVTDDRTAARIIGRLSNGDFWTPSGIRTTPRDAPNYTPSGGWGLLGGVWVAVSFWYASAAAPYSPELMAHALSASFRNYSTNPRGNNTVPGQFSEWLNGETLVNQGMMLSPWFPPRYLWAAIEGMAGFGVSDDAVTISPRLAPDWKWMGVENLPHRGRRLTWFAVRVPDLRIYTNFSTAGDTAAVEVYEEDVSGAVKSTGDSICTIALRQLENVVVFVGNTDERTVSTSIRVGGEFDGLYRVHSYNSMMSEWCIGEERLTPEQIQRGIPVKLERKGFCILDFRQEV